MQVHPGSELGRLRARFDEINRRRERLRALQEERMVELGRVRNLGVRSDSDPREVAEVLMLLPALERIVGAIRADLAGLDLESGNVRTRFEQVQSQAGQLEARIEQLQRDRERNPVLFAGADAQLADLRRQLALLVEQAV